MDKNILRGGNINMKKTIKLNIIDENFEEVEIAQWFVTEGDEVKKGQPLLEVLIDKANLEIEASENGKIVKLLKQESEIIKVDEEIAIIEV